MAWHRIDEEALAALEQTNPEGTVVVDPGEDEEAENTATTKSAAGPVKKPTAADLMETDEPDDGEA